MAREIGSTGIEVYPIGLGAMPLSISGRPDEHTALAVIKAALAAGVDFIDTANSYCLNDRDVGHNERLLATCLARLGATSRVCVATKGGLTRPRGAWNQDARPDRLRRACEQSLRDLRVESIFLYQLHAPDPRVPFAESVGALADLRREGKIRHVGLSNVDAVQLRQAQGIVRVESVQNRCNPTDQGDLTGGLLRLCAEQRVTYIPYSPVGGGYGHSRMAGQRLLRELAGRYGVSAYQVVLAWLLGKGGHVIPIPGASKVGSIQDSAAAPKLTLRPEDARRIDAMGR